MKYKTKIFMATLKESADFQFNTWIQDKNIEIIEFRYQQAGCGDHSIAILYTEDVKQ